MAGPREFAAGVRGLFMKRQSSPPGPDLPRDGGSGSGGATARAPLTATQEQRRHSGQAVPGHAAPLTVKPSAASWPNASAHHAMQHGGGSCHPPSQGRQLQVEAPWLQPPLPAPPPWFHQQGTGQQAQAQQAGLQHTSALMQREAYPSSAPVQGLRQQPAQHRQQQQQQQQPPPQQQMGRRQWASQQQAGQPSRMAQHAAQPMHGPHQASVQYPTGGSAPAGAIPYQPVQHTPGGSAPVAFPRQAPVQHPAGVSAPAANSYQAPVQHPDGGSAPAGATFWQPEERHDAVGAAASGCKSSCSHPWEQQQALRPQEPAPQPPRPQQAQQQAVDRQQPPPQQPPLMQAQQQSNVQEQRNPPAGRQQQQPAVPQQPAAQLPRPELPQQQLATLPAAPMQCMVEEAPPQQHQQQHQQQQPPQVQQLPHRAQEAQLGGPLSQPPAVRQPKRALRQRLSEWALPPGVVQALEDKGVKSMYPWQAAALECGEQYQNLVYCAPTSGGKSLVAEVLLIRRLLLSLHHIPQPRRSKPKYGRVLVVLPYVSIVSEKTEHLTTVLAPMHASVKGFYGAEERGQALAPRGETVACCTIEKANVAINKLAQEGRLGELCCVVVDELHMVGDTDRGVGLEMSLSKLLFSPAARHVQIIGMSATMGGLEHLRAWLRAELFLTNFRPVPLTEHAVFRGKVYAKLGPQELAELEEGQPPVREEREVAPSEGRRDADRLVPLVAEVTSEGHSVLVFCSTRKACESAATLIADLLPQISPVPDPAREAELAAQRAAILADVKIAMGGAMSAELEACMMQGVAWHHAGLTAEERAGVERAYRAGAVAVITATSTLAAGVNLPARRVILRSLHQGIGPVSRSQYLQMVGRAGRAGHSAVGESFIIGKGTINSQEWHQICALLTAPIPCLRSSVLSLEAAESLALSSGASGGGSGASAGGQVSRGTLHLQQLLLEGIANGSVREGADVGRLVCSTFAAQQQGLAMMRQASKAALKSLVEDKKLVQFAKGQAQQLELTHKGRAVYDSALPLEAAMQLYDSCRNAENGFMLDQPMVLLFHCLLTHPFHIVSWPEWGRVLQALSKQEQLVAETVGVLPIHAHAAQSGRAPSADVQDRHARLAAALALSELTQEKNIQGVVAKWGREGFVSKGLTRGQIQKLQQDVGKWMGMASLLCDSAGWWPLATLYANLSQMAAAGVRQDLLPLMKIPDMDATKARALFKAGLRDAQALATADEQSVARALAPAIAAQMRRRSSAGKLSAGASAAQSAANYAAASMATRAASNLVHSARDHLRKQMRELSELAADIMEDELATGGDGASVVPGGQQAQQAQRPAFAPGPAAAAAAAAAVAVAGPAGMGRQGGGNADELLPEELAQIRREVAQVGPGGGAPTTPDKLAAAEVTVAPAAAASWTQGTVRVTELRPRTPTGQVEEFFSLWGAQPRFSLALHCLSDEELATAAATGAAGAPLPGAGHPLPGSAGAAGGAAQRQRLQGLAVCWDVQQSYFLELSAAHSARHMRQADGSPGGATVMDAVRAVLAQQTHKVCYGAGECLQDLTKQGVQLGGQLEDPRLAGALLWPSAPQEDASKLELKRLQASVAPRFKARVPNLCRSGVTATCRTAVLALACMDPLKQLLAHKRMLEAFVRLECPAALALLHINASPWAPRLCAPALAAARDQAQASADLAQEHLRRIYNMPQLELGNTDTLLQLLGSLKMGAPECGKRGRPEVPLDHLQELLRRCRPHQQRERDVLACLVQFKAVSTHLVAPLQALLDIATEAAAAAEQQQQQQQQAGRPGSAGPRRPGSASAAAAEAEPGACHVRRQGSAAVLQLVACTATGKLTYGCQLDRQLADLLAAAWCPVTAAGCQLSIQDELTQGSLTADAVLAASSGGSGGGGGLPVVLCMPRRQLLAGNGGTAAAAVAAEGGSPQGDGLDDGVEEPNVWVAGVLLGILGKRLRAALDFEAEQQQAQQAHLAGGADSSQRVSLAAVRVALLPDEGSRLGSAGGSCTRVAAPRTLVLHWPCNQLWQLTGPSAAMLGGSSAGGISCSAVQQQRPAAALQGQSLQQPQAAVSWGLHGLCSGAAAFVAAAAGAEAAPGLRRKAGHAQQQQQQQQGQQGQQQQQQQLGAAVPDGLPPSSATTGLLMQMDLPHIQLAVLAQLSQQPELLAAMGSSSSSNCASGSMKGCPGSGISTSTDPYQLLSHSWAAAAGRLEVPGTGGAAGQQPVLASAATTQAVVHCLVHGWSVTKLGWVLRCPKQAAAAVLESFLAAFPLLKAWLAGAATGGEAACSAATLAGRQCQFAGLKRADDAMGRGKLHKAILLHVLEGSVTDVLKAALISTHAALEALVASGGPADCAGGTHRQWHPAKQAQQRRREQEGQQEVQAAPGVALVLGHSIILHLPPAFIARQGSEAAAAANTAAAVQRSLRALPVGRAQLATPLDATFCAGRSLHPLDLQPVALPSEAVQQ